MSKIVLRDLIISSKYYKEEEAKELLEVITAKRLETEQQQKLEQQEQLTIEKLRLKIELSRNINQKAAQNNGQTSRVKSLDEIDKMVRLLKVKVPISTKETDLEDETVAARVDLLGKVIPRQAIEDKLSKLVETSISVHGKLVHALVDSVYVPIGLATSGQVNVVHQQVLCALTEVLMEDVLLRPDVLDMLGGSRSKENSLSQSSQYLGGDSGALDEIEVSSRILLENVEDSQSNITSCRNEVGTTITKDEEVTAGTDKGSMVADSFRSKQECCAELALAWEYAKKGKGYYYELDGYLFHRDRIHGGVLDN
ncbi:CCHC-type domain-containing protein [Nephila pilipes]|uniref:CCHC-type domain-containing protein n=1 Tax=Nephila pilipes TaxID=299642 RepID=A0A8X6NA46_NEPPI|nr:CCHC-type domain-containing protein [Nephila pilipes]